jgi:3-oxoacyl-[acyl-carrier protein] reductase
VFLVDLSAERLQTVRAAIGSDLAVPCELDVTDFDGLTSLVADVVGQTGRVDVLVACAGVFDGAASIQETGPELWDRVISINLTGCFNAVKAVSGPMIAQRSGRIITMSSIAGSRAFPDGVAYDASKAGIEGMTRRLAVDLGPHGITANAVAPGVIRTNIRATSEEILGDLVDVNRGVGTSVDLMNVFIPARRAGTAQELAATVFFLASADAGYINGDVIRVDGGWYAV